MIHVGEIALEGLTGSVPGNRSDIEQLIARKTDHDDFDVVLVHDLSRLTRAGVSHLHSIDFTMKAAGIELVSVMDNLPEGETADLVKSVLSFSNKQHAKAIAGSSARGTMSSLLDNRSPYCRRPPYGIDRLYVGSDGQRHHIIRNLPDRSQEMLHPETRAVIRRFSPNERSGIPAHYIKQKSERVVLVPGDERHLEVVCQIYHRCLIDNWGAWKIAEELNLSGVPSPCGTKWTTATVQSLLRERAYLGEGIANRYTSAIYFMRSKDRPLPSLVEPKHLLSRKRPPRRVRSRADWHVQPLPELMAILPFELRELARARQDKYLDRQASIRKSNPDRDRHRDSSYFLKGILHSKQGDLPMSGRSVGRKKPRARYYCVSRAFRAPDGDITLRTLIPAEPLEAAVLEVVRATLSNLPDLRSRVEQQVRSILAAASCDNEELSDLIAERDRITKQLELIVDQFDAEMQDAVAGKIDQLGLRLKSVNQQIRRAQATPRADATAVEAVVEQSVAAVRNLAATLGTAPPASLRRYLDALIGKLVVDLETREVVIEIRLPASIGDGKGTMCLVRESTCKSTNEAHQYCSVPLVSYKLPWNKQLRQYLRSASSFAGEIAAA